MKLIVGLGNPGEKHLKTRHNVGFAVVDKLVDQLRSSGHILENDWKESKTGNLLYVWAGSEVELIKPQTFMNNSGESVTAGKGKHQNLKVDDIYVIHDDLDIKLGEFKLQKGKGPRNHNGVLSIYDQLGTKDFWHVRIGIENRDKMLNAKNEMLNFPRGEEYVLQEFLPEERKVVGKVIGRVVHRLKKEIIEA